jgi:hypothetical protein
MGKVKNLREMLGKRAELVTQARAIDERAEKEGRMMCCNFGGGGW